MNNENYKHHPILEDITEHICGRIQSDDKAFFRPAVAFFLAKMATCMRVSIETLDRGSNVPNIYSVCLSPSGTGKGYSVNILEEEFTKKFKDKFTQKTLPLAAETRLDHLAQVRALRSGQDEMDVMERLYREYESYGEYLFNFDSGTVPAVKQMRQKLLMAGAGSLNYVVDEIGSNFLNSIDVLTAYLELYDQGKIKQKLVKNTADNKRGEEIDGKTPTNALLLGTPTRLLDGAITEKHFYDFLETGYARRCLFSWGEPSKSSSQRPDPKTIFDSLVHQQASKISEKYADYFESLADFTLLDFKVEVPEDISIRLIEYRLECEELANRLPEHEDLRKTELAHRHSKALKLMGVFAFIDKSLTATSDHFEAAVKLVEESGEAFSKILDREPSYARLARYIANVNGEVTHADLMEALPFYKSGVGQRNEQMALATAWAYKHHMIIKKNFIDGIEFFSGEKLKENTLENCIISYSDQLTEGYDNVEGSFENLKELVIADSYHFLNHHLKNGYRSMANIISGFNLLVFDVDGTTTLETAQNALSDYKYLMYTTKSHTEAVHRFRVILPINYNLELDDEDYRETINSVMEWLPFEVDEVSNQRSRKWRTNELAQVFENDGNLVDILRFIPRTQKNEQYQKERKELKDLTSLERWFAERMAVGNRNKQMIKYGFALVSSGMPLHEVTERVHSFNKALKDPLPQEEIDKTILVSVSKKYLGDPDE